MLFNAKVKVSCVVREVFTLSGWLFEKLKESDHHDQEHRLSSRRCQKCLITILFGYGNRMVSDSDKMNVIL